MKKSRIVQNLSLPLSRRHGLVDGYPSTLKKDVYKEKYWFWNHACFVVKLNEVANERFNISSTEALRRIILVHLDTPKYRPESYHRYSTKWPTESTAALHLASKETNVDLGMVARQDVLLSDYRFDELRSLVHHQSRKDGRSYPLSHVLRSWIDNFLFEFYRSRADEGVLEFLDKWYEREGKKEKGKGGL